MKNKISFLFYFLLFALVLQSCGPDKEKIAMQKTLDSIRATDSLAKIQNLFLEKRKQDSLALAKKKHEQDSLALAKKKHEQDSLAKINKPTGKFGTFTDTRDGKVYKTVKIGTQTWMAENLAFEAGSGCWTYNNDESNVPKYGRLYSWETAQAVSPTGWHLPCDEEWTTLTDYLGGNTVAGGKMKATTDWKYHAGGNATNESGFNALPAGYRYDNDGSFGYLGTNADFWSSTPDESGYAWGGYLYYGNGKVYRDYYNRTNGFSVRCIKN